MKTFIKYILQNVLGLKTYFYLFAMFVIVKMRWDKKEKDFFYFMKLITGDGIILDLGANIGVTSYHLAKKFPGSTVFSFEPLSMNMDTLKRIKRKFGLANIQEYQLAVGERNGTIEMVMPVVHKVPMHGLSHVVQNKSDSKEKGFWYRVPVVCLDEFNDLQKSGRKITGVKVDVENFEYFALKGGKKTIAMHRPIIYCELWDNENRKKSLELLNNLGYSAFVLQKKKLLPLDKAVAVKNNFFFLPDTSTN